MQRQTTILLNVVFSLLLMGILMVYSTSVVGTLSTESSLLFYRHVLYAGVGITLMVIAARFDYHLLLRPVIYRALLVGAFVLLGLVLIPDIGVERGGAQRWILLGGVTFQPSEFAKLALIVFLAVKLCENQEHIRTFRAGFFPPVAVTGMVVLLIACERDLGMPVVICATAFLMLLMAGARWSHMLLGLVPGALGVAWLIVCSPYRLERLKAVTDPWKYRDEGGYHLIQSMAAFVRGGLWGQGAGAGEQKLYYLPQAPSDFIFAVWGEEMGLIWTLVMVALFMVFLLVSLRIAICAPDLFGGLLVAGISVSITLQAGVNMAVAIGLLPTKGLPLPFISAGGSALVINLLLTGILLSVSRRASDLEREHPFVTARPQN